MGRRYYISKLSLKQVRAAFASEKYLQLSDGQVAALSERLQELDGQKWKRRREGFIAGVTTAGIVGWPATLISAAVLSLTGLPGVLVLLPGVSLMVFLFWAMFEQVCEG